MVASAAPEIRPALPSDLPALVKIYNHYVTETHVTFDLHPLDVATRREWFDAFSGTGPHRLLVAEHASEVVGYASSSRFRKKPAYDSSVETTIYLHPERTGRGFGNALYSRLLDVLAREETVHRAYGGIAEPNPESVTLHRRLGFELAGTFREVGFKFGRYWDVSWYEKSLEPTTPA